MVFKQSNEVKHKMAITTILSTEKTQASIVDHVFIYVLKHFM